MLPVTQAGQWHMLRRVDHIIIYVTGVGGVGILICVSQSIVGREYSIFPGAPQANDCPVSIIFGHYTIRINIFTAQKKSTLIVTGAIGYIVLLSNRVLKKIFFFTGYGRIGHH